MTINRSAIERPTIESRGRPSLSKGRTNAAVRKRYDSTTSFHFAKNYRFRGYSSRNGRISRAQISNLTWHTCFVASRGRGSRVTVPDYRQICGESIASQRIDRSRDWSSPMKNRSVTSVHVENENEPIESGFDRSAANNVTESRKFNHLDDEERHLFVSCRSYLEYDRPQIRYVSRSEDSTILIHEGRERKEHVKERAPFLRFACRGTRLPKKRKEKEENDRSSVRRDGGGGEKTIGFWDEKNRTLTTLRPHRFVFESYS